MTTADKLDRLLEDVLLDDGPVAAPAGVLAFALDAVAERPQRHPILARLDREAWPRRTPVVAYIRPARPMAWVVLALLLALVAAAAMIGSQTPRPDPFAVVAPELAEIVPPLDRTASLAGLSLVYGSDTGGLFVADADGSGARPILRDGRYIHPRLSVDRRWIAADSIGTLGRSLVVLRPDGSIAVQLRSENPVASFAWGVAGPSAGWLAATIDQSIVVVDPASGARLTIDTGDTLVRALAWSPDAPILWWAGASFSEGGFRSGITSQDLHVVDLAETTGTLGIVDQRTFALKLDPARKYRALEQMAVSPDGRTLAFRARIEGWLRSDLILVDADGGAPTYLNPAPPGEPWLSAWSGIRWLPDGSGVVAEVGDGQIVRPTVLPIDGSPPRPIMVGPLTPDDGGVVETVGPVLPGDTAVLVGGARTWLDVPNGQVYVHDLWVADAHGRGSHLVATSTLGGDLR